MVSALALSFDSPSFPFFKKNGKEIASIAQLAEQSMSKRHVETSVGVLK